MKSKIIISGILAFSNPAAAITVHRVTSMADHGTGTLRAAVSSAASGDRITFAPWLYGKTIRLDSEITINKNLRIEGDINGDRRPDVALDGQHKTRLLTIAVGAKVTLWGMALEHGKANEGGAIYNEGTINAQFCRIHENLATDQGGAIYNRGTLTIDSSSARDNFAANEGGMIFNGKMINRDTAKTTLVASTFAWNTAKKRGGVIYNHEGIFGAINSTFVNNRAQSRTDWENDKDAEGSVLFAAGGSNKLSDSTLMNNKSAPISDPELKDCGIRCSSGCSCRPSAERKYNNQRRRSNNGGTLYSLAGTAPVRIIRTVISKSRGRNCGGWGRYTLDHSWIDDGSCNGDADYSEPGTSWGDAKLGPLANYGGYTYTVKPLPDSGLIDAAGVVCTVKDQRGAPRRRYPDTHCDIGAVDATASAPSRLRPQAINTTPPAEHNEDIAALNSRIETLQTLATATQAAVVERDATIATQRADITAKAETIVTLQGQLGTLQGQLTTLQGQLGTLRGQLSTLQTQAQRVSAENSQEADRLRQQITEKEAQIRRKEEEIAEKSQAADRLRQQITEKEAEIARKEDEIAAHRATIAEKEAQITRKEEEIAEHRERIAEMEAPDGLEVDIGGAGKIDGLRLNGNNVLHDSEIRVKVGSETFNFANTLINSRHERSDGSIVSGGRFRGENGVIYWTITSTVVPRTNFHVSRWEFSSPRAFGDVAVSVYADLDIGQYTGHNGLIVGGTGHPNRLLITDRTNPKEGVALGLRALKNASRVGWVGSPDIYHGRNGDVLDPSILRGAYSGWGQFTPDQAIYPGARGYGPADIAVAMGVKLKPSAKLASFETTIVGAPNGYIE